MKKELFFIILFSFLSISKQFDCSQYYDDSCGGHNTKYNIKCHQFAANAKCQEVEYDDGCSITTDNKCTKTDANAKNYDCYFSTDKTKCRKINIDSGCKVDLSADYPKCSKDQVQDDEDCFLTDLKTCSKLKKSCNLYSDDKCGGLKGIKNNIQCIQIYYGDSCKEISVDEKCQVDETNKNCVARPNTSIDAKKRCKMNEEGTECKLQNKECEEFDANSCNQYGNTCLKVKRNDISNVCRIVTIDSSCQINDNGECVDKAARTDEKKCAFNLDYSECKPAYKECWTYGQDKCESIKHDDKKCSWKNGGCVEFTVSDKCTVENGDCKRDPRVTDAEFGVAQMCSFDYFGKNCTKKDTSCHSYFDNCETHSEENKIQCLQLWGDDYCTRIDIDENCQYDIAYYDCVNKKTIDDSKKCFYNEEAGKKSCKIRDKVCDDYHDEESCNNHNCHYGYYQCYETDADNNCVVDKGQCKVKSGVTLNEDEKCDFDFDSENDKYICKKLNKGCSDYNNNKAKCNSIPKTDKEQCYFISPFCQSFKLDGNCFVDSSGKCVPSGELSSNEICEFDAYMTRCSKKEKQCSDYTDSKCGDFTPQMKLCFNLGKLGCKEVKIDEQCSMNEKSECQGDYCSFDENKERCYYQKDDSGTLLKMKRFILLILLFVL